MEPLKTYFRPAKTDLPLDQADASTRFVALVIVMMSTLATVALGGALVVQALRGTWVDAVQGNLTIEIPADDGKGTIRNADALEQKAKDLQAALARLPEVTAAHALSREEVENLVEPWLGQQAGTADLPLPALIGVSLKNTDDTSSLEAIAKTTASVDAAATLETHQSWMTDLRRFSLALMLAAAAMAGATIACCILSVAGAVHARLAAHQADIDLLHVVGATDAYIGAQFARVVVRLVGISALSGTVLGLILLKAGGVVASGVSSAVMPAYGWGVADYLCFAALPCLITGLCFVAARGTVLRSLRVMP